MSMATRLGGIVIYYGGLPPIKSHDHLTTWSYEITSQTKNIYNKTVPMATKLGRIVTYRNGHLPIKLRHVVLEDHVTDQSHYISPTTVPMTTKLERTVTHLERLLLVKSNDPLTM